MATLVKAPLREAKGIITVTTPERDRLICNDPALRKAIEAVKTRFAVGLHHNWHDGNFRHDAHFDFHMAGEGDLISPEGEDIPLLPLDACNFSPPCFRAGDTEKFWDVLFVARAVKFKGIPEFFRAIRTIYDQGEKPRVLFLCPLPPIGEGTEDGLRQRYESMFTPEERERFTFLTMEFDYPFPLDLPTLAHFYRASRIFVHSAPDERRCRVAAYAWASGLPVVGRECVGSVLPEDLRRPPYFFEVGNDSRFSDAILAALAAQSAGHDFSPVQECVSTEKSVALLEAQARKLFSKEGWQLSPAPIASCGLDLRLGRHHGLASGRNRVEQDLGAFLGALTILSDEQIGGIAGLPDPEQRLAQLYPQAPRQPMPDDPAPRKPSPLTAIRQVVRRAWS